MIACMSAYESNDEHKLFLLREVLVHASYGGLIVAILHDNYKIWKTFLKKEKEGANWRLQPLLDDIKRFGNYSISDWRG
ncbi:hypothetical protein PVK06_003080 [Gossypium arboreum]|uniref:Uncharacterized protein n=1 Tax=Gossypium arboreum TaxID=29729 RepID=A0ABR0R6E5_GOSAR|nr:hypothetical protein PVK06_003080 [Gossypium arboreum]